jgi:hypothetical protein
MGRGRRVTTRKTSAYTLSRTRSRGSCSTYYRKQSKRWPSGWPGASTHSLTGMWVYHRWPWIRETDDGQVFKHLFPIRLLHWDHTHWVLLTRTTVISGFNFQFGCCMDSWVDSVICEKKWIWSINWGTSGYASSRNFDATVQKFQEMETHDAVLLSDVISIHDVMTMQGRPLQSFNTMVRCNFKETLGVLQHVAMQDWLSADSGKPSSFSCLIIYSSSDTRIFIRKRIIQK